MSKQPEAHELADTPFVLRDARWFCRADDELRRQHALIAELRASIERISNAWGDAVQSDLEHGVAYLSRVAAEKFKGEYPEISAVGGVILDEYLKHAEDEQ